jgi:butanol dehydrogenase
MLNFTYHNPTKVYFGKGQVKHLARELENYNSVLLVYGGGSIKNNGIYDQVVEMLKEKYTSFTELSGVQPNPRIASVRQGISLCKENKVDFILAVGAGSTIDCAKAIAFGFYHGGDPWDFFTGKAKITKAIPVGTILTLAATGSEMNGYTVISNDETKEKLATGGDLLRPKFSILDPEFTYTVSETMTAAGVADIMSHVFEQYFSEVKDTFVQDRLAEAILKTCIHFGPVALKDPKNYDARANLMWAGSLALNGLLSNGKIGDWATHEIEHELSAFYDLTHGVGLAILTPHWMEYVLDDHTVDRFASYAANVWGISGNSDKGKMAKEAIKNTQEFFISLGLPAKLSEVRINEKDFEKMAGEAVKFNKEIGSCRKLNKEDILKIYKKAF